MTSTSPTPNPAGSFMYFGFLVTPAAETAYNAAYWLAQPPAVQALQNQAGTSTVYAQALALAQEGYLVDVPIMVWGQNPYLTMVDRHVSGYTWVPSALMAPVMIAPGVNEPGVQSYNPAAPPPGSIAVTISPLPPFNPPVPVIPSSSPSPVGSDTGAQFSFTVPGSNASQMLEAFNSADGVLYPEGHELTTDPRGIFYFHYVGARADVFAIRSMARGVGLVKMRSLISLLLTCAGILSAQVTAQSSVPPDGSSIQAGQLSIIAAVGVPTTAPRHVAAAIGIAQTVSKSQEFFLTVLESPQLNTAGATVEQTSVVLGMTQQLGKITIGNLPLHAWGSAALGTAIANLQKVNLSNSPIQTVASASTSALFTAQYVFGLGYFPPKHPRLEYGPVARYVHVAGEPSQVLVGMYLRISSK